MDNLLRISEAATLAIHSMLCLAITEGAGSQSVKHLASVLKVSEAHLSKVLQRLARAKLVSSRRGQRGGFKLNREPEEISLMDIYAAIHGPLPAGTCLMATRLCLPGTCIMGDVLHRVFHTVEEHFNNTTLADMRAKSSLRFNEALSHPGKDHSPT